MGAWAELGSQLEQWLLPAECLVCQQPVAATEGDALICALCLIRARAISHPICEICGEPLVLGLGCRLCLDWPAGFGPVRSAVRLDQPVRHQLHRFKYLGWWRLAEAFAVRMVPLLQDAPTGAVLVPIPLASGRRKSRGYNQAERLSLAVSALTAIPVRADILRRVRDTPTQTKLAPEGRRANLAEAFVAIPHDSPVILLDDVFTTGATLVSAAVSLLDVGVPEVRGVTFARAEAPLAEAGDRIRPLTSKE